MTVQVTFTEAITFVATHAVQVILTVRRRKKKLLVPHVLVIIILYVLDL